MADARQYFNHDKPFSMHRGGELSEFTLAYETWGKRSENDDNVILICTGLSPDAHAASSADNPAAGWWEFMVGPGKAIDTDRWFVICINSLGSCKGSTGPASEHPDDGEVYATRFPELALEDVAASQLLLLQHLGIDSIEYLVGPSMGGMVALAIMALAPGLVKNTISISSTQAASPFAIAIRSLQRNLVTDDPDWHAGLYRDHDTLPATGMRNARKLGMISYRSAVEWKDRFRRSMITAPDADPFGPRYEIESYLKSHAHKFVSSFDPNCYLYLSRAMDAFDLADHGDGDAGAALAGTALKRALVIGVTTDILFPVEYQAQLRELFSRNGALVSYHPFDSVQGHDAFLVDEQRFSDVVAQFLDS